MRIVLVSPFPVERSALLHLLEDEGHEVSAVATRGEGLALALAAPPDAMIVDAQVACVDGQKYVRELRDSGLRDTRVILICPRGSRAAIASGVCLTKPIDLDQLRRCLQQDDRRFGLVA